MEKISLHDKQIIRELAKQYMEYATDEKQMDMNRRFRATNDLQLVRPPVLIDEIPWHEMDINGELTCQCEDPKVQNAEKFFRRALYRRKYLKADTLFEPFYRINIAYDSTGIGVKREETILQKDAKNRVVSHSFVDVLEDEDSINLMQIPKFTLRPDKDRAAMEFYTELLGDAMPVKLCGHGPYYEPGLDQIVYLRGMEPVLMDLYDRPEYLHAIRQKFLDITLAEIDFIEKNVPVDSEHPNIHCTPALVSGMDGPGLKGTWLRTAAQGFSEVSPAMHDEFDIEYQLKVADRFAYTYYGCCEPLDRKLDIVCKIPNLRKIGVTPWAKEEGMAEYMGGKYVYSRKPNPGNVAIKTDPEVIRKETENTVNLCQKYGCPVEFTLKDISTVAYKPENLIIWANTVSEILDHHYGK